MRERRRFAERGAAELVGHHGFSGRMRCANGARQPFGIPDRFEEKQYHTRAAVCYEQLDQLTHREVGLVAHRHELREAEAARRAAREKRAEHRTAL